MVAVQMVMYQALGTGHEIVPDSEDAEGSVVGRDDPKLLEISRLRAHLDAVMQENASLHHDRLPGADTGRKMTGWYRFSHRRTGARVCAGND